MDLVNGPSRKRARRSSSSTTRSWDQSRDHSRNPEDSQDQPNSIRRDDVEASNESGASSRRYVPKASAACESCRSKKVKCNEGRPICSYCRSHGFECQYRQPSQSSRNDQTRLPAFFERLNQVEKKLDSVLQFTNRLQFGQTQFEDPLATTITPDATPSQTNESDAGLHLAIDHASLKDFAESSPADSRAERPSQILEAFSPDKGPSPQQYVGKDPFTCEEHRPPMPDFLTFTEPTEPSAVASFIEYFFEDPGSTYPIMCETAPWKMLEAVGPERFGENVPSCFLLLIVAVSKAFKDTACRSGVADFQRAMRLFVKLDVQFSLEYVQTQVLSALFLHKKGRLLSFRSSLYAACAGVYTLICRDKALGIVRPINDKNSIRRMYWTCYNLERDVNHEIGDSFPQSALHQLEDNLQLPLTCDVARKFPPSPHIRTSTLFFLAEMSLKAISNRIVTIPQLEFYVREAPDHSVEVSPIILELRAQLDQWMQTIPACLEWSTEYTEYEPSNDGIRLKLNYWFARFSLYEPLILRLLHDPSSSIPFLGWTFFQEGLAAGLTFIKIAILEEAEIDMIMGNRILSAICLVKQAISKNGLPSLNDENVSTVLQTGLDMLWFRIAPKSEWIKCRLYNLAPDISLQTSNAAIAG